MNYLALVLEKKDNLIKKIPSLSKSQQDEIIELFNKKPQFEKRIDWNRLDSLSYDDFRPLLAGGEVRIKSKLAKAEKIIEENFQKEMFKPDPNGNIDCADAYLTSLEGAPQKVGRDFYCYDNKLTSLKGAPQKVGGDFVCGDNTKKFTEEEVRAVCDVRGKIEI